MSLQFSRSLRSLSKDSYRMARIGLILAMVAVAALIFWFFFARVTLFENSIGMELSEGGRLIASFPKESIDRLRAGQGAIVRLRSDTNGNATTLPAVVFSVDTQNNQAEIILVGEVIPSELSPQDFKGQVSVEVAYVTPISLVLRATGYTTAQREIPVSPQTIERPTP